MAVKIRMKMMGSKKRPFFRVVAIDSRDKRDGRFIDTLGFYNPMVDPPEIKFDVDKVYKWLDNGARPSTNVAQLLRKTGLLERWRLLRSGVAIADLDAAVEMRREKQPKAKPKTEKKLSKKQKAKAATAQEGAETEAEAQEKVDEAGEQKTE